MYVPVPYAKADGEAQRELQELGIEEAHMKSDELIEDYCFDATDNQTKAVYPKADVDAAIAELKRENRKLKRALWLARAERAVAEQTVDEWSRYKEKHPFGSWRADPFEYWMQAWICVEKICRKKAEEYK